jgi:MFS family permease
VLDVTIVAIALPEIQGELDFTPAGLPWVVTAYTLVFGGLLIRAGRAGDLYGHRRLLVAGLAVFGAASLACGLAWSAPALVLARAVQGAGAAVVAPAALALVGAAVPAGEGRRRAVAWWTASAASGGASGWLLGGLLVAGPGWRWVFVVNVPVAAAVAVAVRLLLAERRPGGPDRLDVPGAALLTAGLALLGYASTRLQEQGVSGATVAVLLTAAAVLAVFVTVERRARHPVLPLSVLRRPGLGRSVATAAALTATTTPVMFFTVLHQQQVLGVDTATVGLRCAPFNLAVVAGAALGPRATAIAGNRPIMGGGLLLVATGAAGMLRIDASDAYASAVLPALVAMGVGLGLASGAATASGTAAAGREDQGLASGLLNAAAQVGNVLGLAVLVAVASGGTGGSVMRVLDGYHRGFAGAAVAAGVGGLLLLARRPRGSATC